MRRESPGSWANSKVNESTTPLALLAWFCLCSLPEANHVPFRSSFSYTLKTGWKSPNAYPGPTHWVSLLLVFLLLINSQGGRKRTSTTLGCKNIAHSPGSLRNISFQFIRKKRPVLLTLVLLETEGYCKQVMWIS